MIEEHGEGYTCPCHPGKRFAKRKYLTDHLARVRIKEARQSRQLYLFNQDSVVESIS